MTKKKFKLTSPLFYKQLPNELKDKLRFMLNQCMTHW
eukprot:CAMPEP_0117077422 /NCGR_PEP_ID=MMETSP0472-20121206/54592_1 /TAXON_ID=693140 ORGANISM="Tiarina fusus, Strain LIS" /NCGR_SAMPLE_ID=MMETSP0472 /ASSEMBLY_ACC=CAM_ASM_000603 /LENGTH=36 /DNA_ID= /DNA_START= /DNA_END= /DNA_ORIENTATION=